MVGVLGLLLRRIGGQDATDDKYRIAPDNYTAAREGRRVAFLWLIVGELGCCEPAQQLLALGD